MREDAGGGSAGGDRAAAAGRPPAGATLPYNVTLQAFVAALFCDAIFYTDG
eukprot:COSAG05_NODE_3546_length_1998_cov_27.151132_2_plen_51_part_00